MGVLLGTAAGALALLTTLPAAPAAAQEDAPATTAAAPQDATEIMKEAHLNLFYAGDDGSAVVEMTLEDERGKTRSRKFVMVRRDAEDGGEQKYYTYFLEPGDVRKTSFMVWKYQDKDDSRWIYIPAVDLVKRISSKDKGSSFVGSDFSYEDVSGRHWTEDDHTLLREEELDGKPCWVIESVPKSKDAFAKKVTWVGKEHMLPLKEEFYDKKDRLERTFLAEEIEEVGGYVTVTRRSMKNERKNHRTVVEFTDVQYDIGVEDDVFTERHLKNPPADVVGR
jgi:outer membrane lipoprotein-sorting protein